MVKGRGKTKMMKSGLVEKLRRSLCRRMSFFSLLAGLALVLSFSTPAAAATTPPVQITLGGSGATPWNIGNIAPGQSGTKVITVQNTGLYTGDLTMWISHIVNTEGTPPQFQTNGTGDLGAFLTFKVTSTQITSNISMPALLGSFPGSAIDTHYVKVYSLRPAELITMTWQWSLPASTGNIVQGDSLSFDINYLLEQQAPPTTTVPPVTTTEAPPLPTMTAPGVYNLNLQVHGSGTTTPPPGIYPANAGDIRYILAVPAPGNHFVNWTGDVADKNSASTSVILDSDQTVIANFAADAPSTTTPPPTTTLPPTTTTTPPPPTSTITTTSGPPVSTAPTTTPTSPPPTSATETPTTEISTSVPVPTTPAPTIVSEVAIDLTGKLDENGLTESDITIYSGDLEGDIVIHAGTRLVDSAGNPLTGIILYTYSDQKNPLSVVLIILPSGASLPVTLVLHYDKSQVSAEEIRELGVYVQLSNGDWELVPGGVVDEQAGTVTVQISHFSIYAVRLPGEPSEKTAWWVIGITSLLALLILMFLIVLRVRSKSDKYPVYASKKLRR
jgi:hypothetical protein